MTTTHTDNNPTEGARPEIHMGKRDAPGALAARLKALEGLDHVQLRVEWRRLYRVEPPKRIAREFLALGVGWKIQEQVHGGLRATTRRMLAELSKTLERDGDVTRSRVTRLKPGAKLIREWHGKTHTVIVLEEGFEWRGKHWRSLSVIARTITGMHWSGPRFFGLNGKTSKLEVKEAAHA